MLQTIIEIQAAPDTGNRRCKSIHLVQLVYFSQKLVLLLELVDVIFQDHVLAGLQVLALVYFNRIQILLLLPLIFEFLGYVAAYVIFYDDGVTFEHFFYITLGLEIIFYLLEQIIILEAELPANFFRYHRLHNILQRVVELVR